MIGFDFGVRVGGGAADGGRVFIEGAAHVCVGGLGLTIGELCAHD